MPMGWEDKWKPKDAGGGGGQRPPINIPDIKIPKLPKLDKKMIPMAIAIAVALWLGTGFYKVELNARGVVMLFGKFNKISDPGLNWFLPSPIGNVVKVRVEEIKRIELGFRSGGERFAGSSRNLAEESIMLTKSVNMIDINMVVQYQVTDPVNYLFKIADISRRVADRGLESTVRNVAEAALREVVGRTEIDQLLTTDKGRVQTEVAALMQLILNKYDAGINIALVQFQDVHPPQEVRAAFKDVNNAEEDKNRLIREAEGYLNSVIPVTRGKVEQVLKEAEAYREEKIKMAEGDASRFNQLLKEYRKAKNVTRKRLYLETVETVLANSNKLVIDKNSSGKMMPVLNIGNGGNGGVAVPASGAAANGGTQ